MGKALKTFLCVLNGKFWNSGFFYLPLHISQVSTTLVRIVSECVRYWNWKIMIGLGYNRNWCFVRSCSWIFWDVFMFWVPGIGYLGSIVWDNDDPQRLSSVFQLSSSFFHVSLLTLKYVKWFGWKFCLHNGGRPIL